MQCRVCVHRPMCCAALKNVKPSPPNPYISETAFSCTFQKVYTYPPPGDDMFAHRSESCRKCRKVPKPRKLAGSECPREILKTVFLRYCWCPLCLGRGCLLRTMVSLCSLSLCLCLLVRLRRLLWLLVLFLGLCGLGTGSWVLVIHIHPVALIKIFTSRTPRKPGRTQVNPAGVGRCEKIFRQVSAGVNKCFGRCYAQVWSCQGGLGSRASAFVWNAPTQKTRAHRKAMAWRAPTAWHAEEGTQYLEGQQNGIHVRKRVQGRTVKR